LDVNLGELGTSAPGHKYMIFRTFLTIAVWAAGAALAAPLPVVPGEWALAAKAVQAPQLRLGGIHAPTTVLPVVSAAEIASVRAANQRAATHTMRRRLIVGVVRPQAVLPQAASMAWAAVPGGYAARVAVSSPDAGSLRLAIDLMGVPEDVEMVFFGADATRLEGPVKVADVPDRFAPWWSPLTEGATQTVEFFVPSRHDPRSVGLRIAGASHVFTTPSSRLTKRIIDIGDADACNVDVACSPLNASAPFRQAAASEAQLVFNDANFTGLCSGTLLADADSSTQKPWVYSANHCFDNEAAPYKTPAQMQLVANTLTTLWLFQANGCSAGTGSNVPESGWSQVPGGAFLAHSNLFSDVLLVRLNGTPPSGAFYSGWDANTVPGGTSLTAIHHPQGDLKKVSQGIANGFGIPGVGDGSSSYLQVRWNSGTTEPGSSGGGLFSTSNGQYFLRGGLWGGTASCTNPLGLDYFSRFDQVYPNIASYLGPVAAPTADYTDLWWNPNESGWGLNLTQHPSNVVFGVWYTYEADGTRTWYVMPNGTWTTASTYTGPLYATTGPSFVGTFNPANVHSRQVGSATLAFTSTSTANFAYSVDGVSGAKSIQRQPY